VFSIASDTVCVGRLAYLPTSHIPALFLVACWLAGILSPSRRWAAIRPPRFKFFAGQVRWKAVSCNTNSIGAVHDRLLVTFSRVRRRFQAIRDRTRCVRRSSSAAITRRVCYVSSAGSGYAPPISSTTAAVCAKTLRTAEVFDTPHDVGYVAARMVQPRCRGRTPSAIRRRLVGGHDGMMHLARLAAIAVALAVVR